MSQVVLLRLGQRSFALDLAAVRHILLTPQVFALAGIRPGFRGVFLYEDAPVPFLDLGTLVGDERDPPGAFAYTFVCDSEAGPLGLPADQVLQIVPMDRGAVAEARCERPDSAAWQRDFVYQGKDYPFFDVEAMLMTLPR